MLVQHNINIDRNCIYTKNRYDTTGRVHAWKTENSVLHVLPRYIYVDVNKLDLVHLLREC
jgi:hypothetical protein